MHFLKNPQGIKIYATFKKALNEMNEEDRGSLLSLANKINKNVETLTPSGISNHRHLKENDKMSTSQRDDVFYEIDLNQLREAVDEIAGDETGC